MKASVFVGASLDGFIARPDGGIDFLPEEPEPHGFDEFLASVDALVMGRNTYQIVLDYGVWFYGDRTLFVMSHNELPNPPEGGTVERISGTPQGIVADLEKRGIGHIYVDGGDVVHQFMRARLINSLIITTVPVLIGSGISVFGALDADIPLRHVRTKTYPSGLVQTEWEVLSSGEADD